MEQIKGEQVEEIASEELPAAYVIFERIRNKGLKEKRSKKDPKVILMEGEKIEKWVCKLVDDNDDFHTWATADHLRDYIKKGYRVLGHGGVLEKAQAQVDQNHPFTQFLYELHYELEKELGKNQEIDKLKAENEALKAQLGGGEDKQDESLSSKSPSSETPEDEVDIRILTGGNGDGN